MTPTNLQLKIFQCEQTSEGSTQNPEVTSQQPMSRQRGKGSKESTSWGLDWVVEKMKVCKEKGLKNRILGWV